MKHRTRSSSAKPDMTPMMDIVFILIIFFVVTASFTRERGMEPTRPSPGPTDSSQQMNQLTLRLLPGHRIDHGGRFIDVWAATSLMKRFHVENEKEVIVLRPEAGAELGLLIRLLDSARTAGLPKGAVAVL